MSFRIFVHALPVAPSSVEVNMVGLPMLLPSTLPLCKESLNRPLESLSFVNECEDKCEDKFAKGAAVG